MYTLTMTELVRETGYAPATIRTYACRGLIPRPDRPGTGALWSPSALTILLAFRKLYHPDNRLNRADVAIAHGLDPKGV